MRQDAELATLFEQLEAKVQHHNTQNDLLRSVCVALGLEMKAFDEVCVGCSPRNVDERGVCA